MPLGEIIRRNGFSIALAASVAVHGGAAFCSYCASDREAQVAPFRRGRTTVNLRPTIVEPPSPEPTDDPNPTEPEPPPPEIEPTVDDRPALPSFVSAPPREIIPERREPALPADRPDPTLADRESLPKPTPTAPPETRVRRQVDAAQLDEVLQPLLSVANEGGKDEADAAVHTQPSPPFPPHLPRQPVRLRLDYTIDSEGRFRDVRIDSGSAQSDALIARFIESRWRATPATCFGRPVSKAYWGFLNFN
ncbi:MAG: hypothetical protein DCC68_24335 [Planctomycetota bacterium]|nr:MAG: hypothetical protein DCC68_24335 [Planctomycetota bacterium]